MKMGLNVRFSLWEKKRKSKNPPPPLLGLFLRFGVRNRIRGALGLPLRVQLFLFSVRNRIRGALGLPLRVQLFYLVLEIG